MISKLSTREKQVLALLALGLKLKDVAEVTGLSNKTASTYFLRIQTKRGTAGLNHYAIIKDALESLPTQPEVIVLPFYTDAIKVMQRAHKAKGKAVALNSINY